MTGINLYNVVGVDDLEGMTFTRCTTMDKAVKAKKLLENNGFEDILEITQDNLAVDTLEIAGELIEL